MLAFGYQTGFFYVVVLNLEGGETITSDFHFIIAADLQALVNHLSPKKNQSEGFPVSFY